MIMMFAGNDVTGGPREVTMATENVVITTSSIRCLAYRQQGAVLVIGMILLLVLTVIGVTMMTSTTQDEKLSGNTKRGSDAFMAAEAGTHASVDMMCREYIEGSAVGEKYLCDGPKKEADGVNPPEWFYYSCKDSDNDGQDELFDADGNRVAAAAVLISTEEFNAGSTFNVEYSDINGDGWADCAPKMQNGISLEAVESMSLLSVGNQTNSERMIHYNIGHSGAGGDASWPAVFVNDDPEDPQCIFDFGPSAAYLYDGKGGPALSTNSQACADDIRDADTSDGQLVGGVIANNPAPDFTAPGGLRNFYEALIASDRTQNVYPDPPKNANKGVEPVDLSKVTGLSLGDTGDADDANDYDEMEVIIVHGDVNMPGNLSGSGVLVITGSASFGGTPNWDGLVFVLGGHVDIGGGGTTNGLDGSLIVSNIDFNTSDNTDNYVYCNQAGECQASPDADHYAPSPKFDDVSWGHAGTPEIAWDVSGGGTARYSYGCNNLMKVDRFLLDDDEVGIDPSISFPGPDDCPDTTGDGEDSGDGVTGSYGYLHVFNWLEDINN
jgi:hypothetical protein